MGIDDLPTGDDQRSQFRRPGFLAALAFVVLVVILGVIVATGGGGKSTATTATGPSTEPAQPTASASSVVSGNSCQLSDTSQTVPTAEPPNTTWKIYNNVALPFSTSGGPGIVDGDVARCYAHTPVGALLAATQLPIRYLLADNWQPVVDEQVMPGKGRDAYVKMRSQSTDNSSSQPGDFGQIAGFHFVTYTPSVAVVQLVNRFSDGTLQVTTETVDWSGGDWKLQLQPDGGTSPTAQQVSSLAGYSAWGGL